jgi:VWFA-related protein
LDILILIDASASQERMLPDEKIAAENFINNVLRSGTDRVAVAKFTGEVDLIQDLTNDYTLATEGAREIKVELPPGFIKGGVVVSKTLPTPAAQKHYATSIWDSVNEGSRILETNKPRSARRAILLISDGMNTSGDTKFRDAATSLIKKGISVYAIGIGDNYYYGVDSRSLKKITEQTGGLMVIPKGKIKALQAFFQRMEQSLRNSYEIRFSSPSRSNELQELRIDISNRALSDKNLLWVKPIGYILSD